MSFAYAQLADYARAYSEGRITPLEVVERLIRAVEQSDREQPPLRAAIHLASERALRRARESSRRYQEGSPLSPLDGVVVAIKDNLDMAGEPTSNGTLIEFPIPDRDAWVVTRLEELGAIVLIKANLHEIGGGTTGINPSQGTARNPHDDRRWCGGSSSGSACAVGAGLVPLAIGTDAGGSVRSPAAFCGVVGLKPTFGRLSRGGLSIVCDTLDHIGPITTSVGDAALTFSLLSASVHADEETWDQPSIESDFLEETERPVAGMRIGYARSLLSHPRVDPAIADLIERGAESLRTAGAELVEVEVPSLIDCMEIGLLILAAEGPSGREQELYANEHLLGADLQVLLRVGEHVGARDYMHAQRMRRSIRQQWREILEPFDALYLSGPVMPAGLIQADALLTGEIDEATSLRAIATTFPSNLTGFPAITVPLGWSESMPVAGQFVALPWREATVLRLARHLERAGLFSMRRPQRYYGDERVLP